MCVFIAMVSSESLRSMQVLLSALHVCDEKSLSGEKMLPIDQRSVMEAQLMLAKVYRTQGRLDEAKAAFETAAGISSTLDGDNHADTLGITHRMAKLAEQRGEYKHAVTLHKTVLHTIAQESWAPAHTLRPLRHLAAIAEKQGDIRRAVGYLRQMLAVEGEYCRAYKTKQGEVARLHTNIARRHTSPTGQQGRYGTPRMPPTISIMGHLTPFRVMQASRQPGSLPGSRGTCQEGSCSSPGELRGRAPGHSGGAV